MRDSKNQKQFSEVRMSYSVAEAAQLLGVSTKSIRRLMDRGLIRGSKALRKVIIPKTELEKFLNETIGAE